MSEVVIDDKFPIRIQGTFDTPLRVNVEFLKREKGEKKFSTVFASNVSNDVPTQVVDTRLDPIPKGSTLLLTMVFTGAKNTGFRASIVLSQKNVPLGKANSVHGTTGDKFARFREVEVSLK